MVFAWILHHVKEAAVPAISSLDGGAEGALETEDFEWFSPEIAQFRHDSIDPLI